MSVDDFANTLPVFLPEVFFLGRLEGWAVFESVIGGLQKRATLSVVGTIEADTETLLLAETYEFDDGFADTLHWRIRRLGPGRYVGHENRIEGEAEGEQAGCAFNWRYTRDTPRADGAMTRLSYDDWFYAIDENACMVRGTAGRAGIPFAIAHVVYHRLGQ